MGKEFRIKDVDEALGIVSKWLSKEAIEQVGIRAMEKFTDAAIKKCFGEDLVPLHNSCCSHDSRVLKGVEEYTAQGSIDKIFPYETGLNLSRAFGSEDVIHPLVVLSDKIRSGISPKQIPFLKFGQFVNIKNNRTDIDDGCPDHFIFEVAHITDTKVIFVAQQILNHKHVDPDGVKDFPHTTLATHLNGEFLDKFPKEIVDRICLTHDGMTITIPSRTEVFGKDDNYENDYNWDDTKNTQFEFFKLIKNRIKTNFSDDDTWWWWTRSPHSGDTTYVCAVNSNGGAASTVASNPSGGVSPCFALS